MHVPATTNSLAAVFRAAILGPLALRTWTGKTLGVALVLALIVLTQVGGLFAWVGAGLVSNSHRNVVRWIYVPIAILIAYGLSVFTIVPAAAKTFGRVQLSCFAHSSTLAAHNIAYCLTNRNYVTVELAKVLSVVQTQFVDALPERKLRYLDAGFPFGGGFPLLPHLSHSDGRRIDLMFLYTNEQGKPVQNNGSPIGYLAFVEPPSARHSDCPKRMLTLRWDLDWLQPLLANPHLDERATRKLLTLLAGNSEIGKIFIEPHLKARLNLRHDKIRFQGCRAARHDDHIHVQL